MGFSSQTDIKTIKIYWRELIKDKSLFMVSLLFPISVLLLNTAVPLFIGRILASLIQTNNVNKEYVYALVIVAILGIITNRYGFRAFLQNLACTMRRLQDLCYESLVNKSIGFHNNRFSGQIVSDAIGYDRAFQQIYYSLIGSLMPFIVIYIGALVLISFQSLQIGTVVLIMGIYAFGSSLYYSEKRRPLRKLFIKQQTKLISQTSDSLSNVQSVITFANEPKEVSSHDNLSQELLNRRLHNWTTMAGVGNIRIIILFILQFILLYVLVINIQNNSNLVGIGIFTFIFAATFFTRFFDLDTVVRTVEDALSNAEPMTKILLEKNIIQDINNAKKLIVKNGDIKLNDVSFYYQDNKNKDRIFNNLELHIKPGQSVGIVGPSGGGKTTLTKLLLRFEDVSSGQILIDNQNIALVTQNSLRQQIAYVPQEPLLFHRTIYDNIAYGNQHASEKDVIWASKLAYADNFIKSLPNGYKTLVGERGIKLSGGQRQRIAIARAIIKNAPILIFDEATSALDSESEQYIQKALLHLIKNRTTIVVAHRLSTIQRLDRIVVIDSGKITEDGPHSELLKNNNSYAKLWEHQSGGFIVE
ncbi:MAG: ATP-binding cassette, subfamily bacterial [Patescibacteria group bacterium]|nr:ATP-binding cassette, subfamily bacterial [Patescibacteria group bacterium]